MCCQLANAVESTVLITLYCSLYFCLSWYWTNPTCFICAEIYYVISICMYICVYTHFPCKWEEMTQDRLYEQSWIIKMTIGVKFRESPVLNRGGGSSSFQWRYSITRHFSTWIKHIPQLPSTFSSWAWDAALMTTSMTKPCGVMLIQTHCIAIVFLHKSSQISLMCIVPDGLPLHISLTADREKCYRHQTLIIEFHNIAPKCICACIHMKPFSWIGNFPSLKFSHD